jgi:hypothetical protein
MTFDDLRRPHEQVERKATIVNRLINAHRLLDLVPCRHHHEQIPVAIRRGITVGIGAEEYDFVRVNRSTI